jgi:ribosomal protein S18 acetylase RimI-like enzyme
MAYRLVPFGRDAAAPAADLARLHASLLPESPVSMLGRRFMERFYYRVLPQDGLILGAVAYLDDQPAGFVVATPDSAGFMRAALRRRWPSFVWAMGTSILLTPKSIGPVLEAARAMRQRQPVSDGGPDGEILSLGVLPGYQERLSREVPGTRISADLLGSAVARLQARGIGEIRAMVKADNTPAKLFYIGLGWTLRRSSAPEWRMPTAEFVWRA